MPPTQKETVISQDAPAAAPPPRSARPNGRGQEAAKSQPVCLEMPVSVHGACNIEGSDKREKFHEATHTVLIFASGAVLRLAASVSPGQLLFLTNERSKREIVCQVVKSKSYRNVSGYVELEFSEPCPGFWGVSFPGERPAVRNAAAQGSAALPVAVNAESIAAPPLPRVVLPPPPAGPAESYSSAPPPIAASVAAAENPLAPAEPMQLSASSSVDRFAVTQDVDRFAVTQNKEEAPEQAAPKPPAIPAVIEENLAPGEHPAALETGPASLTFLSAAAPVSPLPASELEAQVADDLPVVPQALAGPVGAAQVDPFAVTHTNVPQEPPANFLLSKNEVDRFAVTHAEVSVPNWLSPPELARPSEPRTETNLAAKSGANIVAKILPLPECSTEPELATNVAEPIGYLQPGGKPFVAGPRAVREAPAFGRSILLAEEESAPAARPGARRGLFYLVAAAAILVSLAGAKWYLRQPEKPPEEVAGIETAPAEVSSAMIKKATQPEVAKSAVAGNPVSTSVSLATTPADSLPPIPIIMDTPAAPAKQAAPVAGMAGKASKGPTALQFVDPEKQPKKLPRGIRLAAPVVSRRAAPDGAAAEDVNLGTLPGAPMAADVAAGLPASHSEPALPRSGGLQPARLLFSVPPAYPPLARSEGIAGDVVLDALIAANGQVTAMKILSGHMLLQQAAKDALRHWRYQPAMLDGQPASTHLTVTIQFRLQR